MKQKPTKNKIPFERKNKQGRLRIFKCKDKDMSYSSMKKVLKTFFYR